MGRRSVSARSLLKIKDEAERKRATSAKWQRAKRKVLLTYTSTGDEDSEISERSNRSYAHANAL